MIHDARVQSLNDEPVDSKGRYVLYWMQASQRTRFNHALEYAIREANTLQLPVLACFGLTDDYPEANERHYAFMLEGLADVAAALHKRGIQFVVRHGNPPDVALHFANRAALVVCDRGYLRHQRQWRDAIADDAKRLVVQVESDAVVPVETASDHDEFAARTIRPRIKRQLEPFLVRFPATRVKRSSLDLKGVAGDIDISSVDHALARLRVDRTVARIERFVGGEEAGRRLLSRFVHEKLSGYAEGRNEPSAEGTSTMSPYLHFGQISPLEIALAVREAVAPQADRDAYLEELIVRRELSLNHVYYNARYDTFDGLPDWARKTLKQHARDKRPYVYTRVQLERAQTHDRWWNAAQREMTQTGFMHNYMRMYWGKKILEWKRTSRAAYEDTLYLNNKYFLDGRDPNSYVNVGWIFGLHDRPWGPARPIFGNVRYMNDKGLERKFDMDAYARWVESL